jgi:hypothetical protein
VYKELSVKHFLAQKSITEMEHPPPFPLIWLFPKINTALKGREFLDTEDVRSNVTTALKALP